jgi:hypothetical protein
MSTPIPNRGSTASPTGNTDIDGPSIENLPPEILEHILPFISVHEKTDVDSLASTSKFFDETMKGPQEVVTMRARIREAIAESAVDDRNSRPRWMMNGAAPAATATGAKARSLFADLLPKLKTLASPLRIQLFRELLALADSMEPEAAKSCHQQLWSTIKRLSSADRAAAAESLFISGARAGSVPLPELEIAYGYISIEDDLPSIIGLLSIQLRPCSEAEFPVAVHGLFSKIDRLQARNQCQALLAIRQRLFRIWDRSWFSEADSANDRERRYQQVFQCAFACIANLPEAEKLLAVGEWTAAYPTNLDYRIRDDMTLRLLELIPANVEHSPQLTQAVVGQLRTHFDWEPNLNSLARYRAMFGAIQRFSPACQASLLQNLSKSKNTCTHSGDLQWQAMSEVCATLPHPHKGAVLASLAKRIGTVSDAFTWSADELTWGHDERNTGNSAAELASNTQNARTKTVAWHAETYGAASGDTYYQAASFPITAAVSALIVLTAQVPEVQQIEVIDRLFDSDNFGFQLSLGKMSFQEKATSAMDLRALIAKLSDISAKERLLLALDGLLN